MGPASGSLVTVNAAHPCQPKTSASPAASVLSWKKHSRASLGYCPNVVLLACGCLGQPRRGDIFIAQGVSPGFGAERTTEPRRGDRDSLCRIRIFNRLSAAPPGLGGRAVRPLYAGLAPWAIDMSPLTGLQVLSNATNFDSRQPTTSSPQM